MKRVLFILAFALVFLGNVQAQLAKNNQCKFLGNITTSYNWVEYCDPQECSSSYIYSDYWDQVTCENATKWGSVHKGWGKFEWENADRTYKYCKEKGIIFKFHALIWGSQHPTWIENLSVADTKKAIVEWFDTVQVHYPDLTIIDVVNEAIYGCGDNGCDFHSPYKQTKIIEALTSLANDRLGKNFQPNLSGYKEPDDYQWLAEAFRMAAERWPNATLIYNDYNTIRWQRSDFINLVNGIKACGGPIDACGNQAHDVNDMSGTDFKAALYEIHEKTQLPQYITEYDICKANDATFETRYKEQFPVMWEADFVPGVTLWGWIYGKTWVDDNGEKGASGLVRDCQKRSAFTWLEETYMKSDAAKNATCKYVCGRDAAKGMKGVSLTINASSKTIALGDSVKITAEMEDPLNIKFTANGVEIKDKWVFPCEFYWTPTEAGEYKIEAKGVNNNKDEVTASMTIKVIEVGPYSGEPAAIPGKIEAENYDKGFAGEAYYDLDKGNVCDEYTNYYRSDDIDIKKISDGVAVGHCQKGEWMAYTVDVVEAGKYDVFMRLGCGNSDGGKLYVNVENSSLEVSVDKIGDWGTFDEIKVGTMELMDGVQTMKISIDKDWIDIDWISFKSATNVAEYANNNVISVIPNPASKEIEIIGVGEDVKVEFINLAGSVIKESNAKKISLNDVANGVYMLRITTPNETVVKKLVVKK